jgi:hypothetical protein
MATRTGVGIVALIAAAAIAGCGAPEPVPEARRGLVRVDTAQIALELGALSPAELAAESIEAWAPRLQRAVDAAAEVNDWRTAAQVAAWWSRLHLARGETDAAIQQARDALNFDKQHQLALRSAGNPLPNAANIAVSLATLAQLHEGADDATAARGYAERAWQINVALDLRDRQRRDLVRLERLSRKLGDAAAVSRYRAAYAELQRAESAAADGR